MMLEDKESLLTAPNNRCAVRLEEKVAPFLVDVIGERERSVFIQSTGQSGNPLSVHYDDFA